jgi:hypothetical protein
MKKQKNKNHCSIGNIESPRRAIPTHGYSAILHTTGGKIGIDLKKIALPLDSYFDAFSVANLPDAYPLPSGSFEVGWPI